MLVPKAAMNENGSAQPGKNEIGSTRQVAPVEPKAKPQAMCSLPDPDLRGCVLGGDTRHCVRAAFRGKLVRHLILLIPVCGGADYRKKRVR